jgi:tripartite ATP-independent transporter DctP family solute receptor
MSVPPRNPARAAAASTHARRGDLALDRRALLAGGAVLLTGCGDAQTRALITSDTHPYEYPTVQAVVEMGRLLEERSEGRLTLRIYAGGQLGSERDTLEITTFGGIDLDRVNLAPLNSIEPLTSVPSLPFLFRSIDHMRAAMDGPPGEKVLASLEKHGLIGICFYDSGDRSFYNTRRPIRTPADMAGLKIRVQNSNLYVAMVRALGADATPMDLGEVYQGLVQGVIDGAENNWPSYESGRHYEVARYYSLTRHVMAPEILVMSKSRWDKLEPADQALIRACARESVPYMRTLWDARVESARERVLSAGVEANEVDDQAAFADRMRPVWEQFAVSPEQRALVDEILALEHSGEDADA